ncbi:MAG: hypothetical protein H7841_06640 [Magnetospirillum sp. WYHS-4]
MAFRYRLPGMIAGTALGAAVGLSGVAAQEPSCDALVAEALKGGEIPAVVVDPQSKAVELRTSRGACREAAGKWASRRVQTPSLAATAPPEPAAPETTPVTAAQPPVPPPKPPPPRCELRIEGLYGATRVRLGGELFWLTRVYTIDYEDDGRTDNLGFRLKSAQGREVTLQYLPQSGDVGGNTVPELQLPDDRTLPRICFGAIDLAEPATPDPGGMSGMVIAPDLAGEARGRVAGVTPGKAEAKGRDDGSLLWIILAGASGLLLGAAAVLWLTTHGKHKDLAEEAESDEEAPPARHASAKGHPPAHGSAKEIPDDDDEEEAEPKKKGGFSGLLARLGIGGRKPESDEAEVDERKEDGQPHPRGKPAARPATPQRAMPGHKAKPSK